MFLLLLISLILSVNCQPCKDVVSVDISDGTAFSDGTIVKDGVKYPPKYTYAKNVSGEIRAFGCLCEINKCYRKCCPAGTVMSMTSRSCEADPDYDLFRNSVNVSYHNNYLKTVDVRSHFTLMYGRPCAPMVYENRWFLQEDGKLYINVDPPTYRGPDKYCVDTFVTSNGDVKEAKFDALICFPDTPEEDTSRYLLSACCMIASCVFLLITVGVYAWLPELRNLHGKVLMAYLVCLFFGFGFMASMQLMLLVNSIYAQTCLWLTILIYYSLESAFFWLNVMCFDIWWTFSGKRGPSGRLSSQTRFKVYSLYAFGLPALLTILLLSLEFSGIKNEFMPQLNDGACFLSGYSRLIYLYGPIVILCIVNLVFFILTAVKITEIKRQTSVLKSKESSTHDVHRNDKQRLTLYIKLFAVMGINWILEVISSIWPNLDGFWKVTDTYNVLIGLIVFIIFVCKRKTLRLIKKRMGCKEQNSWETVESRPTLKYKQLRGETISRTQTTTSTRTVTSRDDMQMASIKNKT